MRSAIAAGLAASVCMVAMATPAQAQQRQFNIPAGTMKAALDAYGRQSGRPIIYKAEEVRGVASPGYRGSASPEDALDALLSNTGFSARRDNSGAVAIVRSQEAATSAELPDEQEGATREEIVVTGTSIRGVNPNSASLDVYTRKEFENLGVITVDQLLRAIPQNLNSTGAVGANSIGRAVNARSINSPDLRGLGPGATLSLLNGRRLPLVNLGRGTDLSLIPLGAVERVEVLTDGASSIYGADAVGGVLNFILRDKYEGASMSASYGVRSDGGYSEIQHDETAGTDWGTGGGLVSFSYRSADPLKGKDLDFVDSDITTISPEESRFSAFLSAHQNLGSRSKLFADILYSDRRTETVTEEGRSVFVQKTASDQIVASTGFSTKLFKSLNFDLVATHGVVDDAFASNSGRLRGPFRRSSSEFASTEVTAKVDGKLLQLASEDVLFALGAGYLRQDLERTSGKLGRRTKYAFGELVLPVIGAERNVPLVERLEFNVSARYTSTSDFGDSLDPKVGVYWKMNAALAARGTWSRSFRAPELLQLVEPESFILLLPVDSFIGNFPDPFTNDRSTVYLNVSDFSNPNLNPETSQSFTAGIDFTPPSVRGLKVSATYYNINYTNRIALPPSIEEIAADPELYAEFIQLPDRATIEALAGRAVEVFDAADESVYDFADPDFLASRATRLVLNGITNLASQKASGVDVEIGYSTLLGKLRLNGGAKFTYFISSDDKASKALPALRRLDLVSYPVSLRGRAYLGVNRGGWSGQLTLNHVNDYRNTDVAPPARVDSWTTLDLTASYRFGKSREGVLKGIRFGLTARNLFNTDPPFVEATDTRKGSINRINYDATNHDPFGRMIVFNLTKEW